MLLLTAWPLMALLLLPTVAVLLLPLLQELVRWQQRCWGMPVPLLYAPQRHPLLLAALQQQAAGVEAVACQSAAA